ncbi:MAG TPA: phytoene desaturase family protein [Gemmatales bacterium]|nr:phytoene desaturase family protein [Gemmatales bacterium]HMP60477.1 phytoene desaturase family protein [Gemmatales bacterium]
MALTKAGRIGVVGGGLGGLAAACTLAARGYDVFLCERNDWLGGKAAVLETDGFRFDMGPTILTLPSVLKRIFAEAGRDLAQELELIPLDPQWRCFYTDGSTLDLVANVEQMQRNLESYAPGSADGYAQFMKLAERLHDISKRFYFYKPIGSVWDMMNVTESFKPSIMSDLWRMRFHSTVAGTVRKFVKDHCVAQMLDHFTQYVGSAPNLSPAVLCGIAHMQTDEGVWYPRGGTRAVPVALTRLAQTLGVEIMTECAVTRITTNTAGRVNAIETATHGTLPCVAVVSNMDSVRTHQELLGHTPAEAKFLARRSYEPACSGVVLYLGLKQRYDHVLHHNFIFSRDPEEEFADIYRRGEPASDPTCYVAAPSLSEPEVAPPGGEALYVLVHTPYLRSHHDWSRMLPDYRRVILDKLKTTGKMPDLEERIVVERTLTPQDIHDRYQVLNGAIYGLASHGRLSGGFKPCNRSPDVEGLYLAGGAAHPGPGMPMVLMSGWIAGDTLDRDQVVLGRKAAG